MKLSNVFSATRNQRTSSFRKGFQCADLLSGKAPGRAFGGVAFEHLAQGEHLLDIVAAPVSHEQPLGIAAHKQQFILQSPHRLAHRRAADASDLRQLVFGELLTCPRGTARKVTTARLLDARPSSYFFGEMRHAAAKTPGTLGGAKNVDHAVWFAQDSGARRQLVRGTTPVSSERRSRFAARTAVACASVCGFSR